MIGPFRGGRVVAVSGVPGDSAAAYFGSVGGGVWKSQNAGVTWNPIFDRQPIASIGAIAISPSNPNLIYAGTGESDIRSDLSSGDGVYKSTDAGNTWTNIGLRDSRQISRIVIDPKNPDVVFVAALGHAYGPNSERGIYKSIDGGGTWTQVLNKGPQVGASDIAIASSNPKELFAGLWQARRPPWSTYAPLQGPGSALYRSTDSGATWSQLSGHGLPDGEWGRVGVAVAPDGRRGYALIDAGKGKSGLYRSDDGGNNWTLANEDPRLTSRSWYFNWLTVDPSNPDVVYFPNVALYRTEDGGKTISIVRGAPGGDDYHDIWVDPQNPAHLVLGTDQGTSVSLDRGATWSSWYNQPVGQFYHVDTDDRFPYAVYGAQQDSGSAAVYSRTDHGLIGPGDWFLIGGGESGYIVVDRDDPNILYATGVYGSVVRYDRRTSLSQDITPWPYQSWGTDISGRKYRAPWTPVLVQSPTEKSALYMGTQYVLKTTDGGLHWAQISPDLTGGTQTRPDQKSSEPATVQNAKERGYGVVYTIAPSPKNSAVLWAGSDTGLIHLSQDGGKSWRNVTPSSMSDWSRVSMIEASHSDLAVAYAAVDRHRMDDYAPHLFRTRDYGKTWKPITSGIAANSFVNVVREDPVKKGLLFAGTELGSYVSFDDGDHWQPLQLNLPVTSVRDLQVHGDDLIAATHGRAFWILDNITPLRQVASEVANADAWFYQPATAIRVDYDPFLGTPLPPEEPAAKNPPEGAMFDYVLKSTAKEITLEISDAKGRLVRRVRSGAALPAHPPLPIAERWFSKPATLDVTSGMHRYVWDLRWRASGEGELADDDDAYGAPAGPRVAPGAYGVKLTVDGRSFTRSLQVAMDPRAQVTTAQLEEQQRMALEIFAEVSRAGQLTSEMDSANKRIAQLKSEVHASHPELETKVTELEKAITAIQKGTPVVPGTISGLTAAHTGLLAALRVVEGNYRPAPAQALEVYRASVAAAHATGTDWQKLKSGALADLNASLSKAGLQPITIALVDNEKENQVSK